MRKHSFMLEFFFEQGIFVKKSIIKSIYWYRKALLNGIGKAGFCLGNLYLSNGNNFIEKSIDKALYWFEQGFYAIHSDIDCAYEIGLIYEIGDEITCSYKKAFYWYKKGAEKGNIGCQEELGRLYFAGCGIKKDFEKGNTIHLLKILKKLFTFLVIVGSFISPALNFFNKLF